MFLSSCKVPSILVPLCPKLNILDGFHQSTDLTLTEVFTCFSPVVRPMPGYNPQRRGTARTLPKFFVLFYVLFVLCRSVYCLCANLLFVLFGSYLCCSMYCLCVNVYCHRVATQLQLTNIS
jgi:hypothetical protein